MSLQPMNPKPSKLPSRPWTGPAKLPPFHYENKDAIHQAVQGLRNQYKGKFDAMAFLEQLDQLDQRGQDKSPDDHWIFTSPAAMIGAAICLLGVGYCFWRCCCRAMATTTVIQPLPSAPPMPMPAAPVQLPVPIQKTQNHGPRNNGTTTDRKSKNNAIPINITITKRKTSQKEEPRRRGEISETIYFVTWRWHLHLISSLDNLFLFTFGKRLCISWQTDEMKSSVSGTSSSGSVSITPIMSSRSRVTS